MVNVALAGIVILYQLIPNVEIVTPLFIVTVLVAAFNVGVVQVNNIFVPSVNVAPKVYVPEEAITQDNPIVPVPIVPVPVNSTTNEPLLAPPST